MREQIINFPKQFKEGLELSKSINIKGDFDSVVVSGMGGSAWPAELLFAWLQPEFHWQVNRGYALPSQTNKNTLTIFCSYSGNTEECLSAYNEALEKGLTICAVTSGGKLEELCQKNNNFYIKVPEIKAGKWPVPRMATGYIFSALYSILVSTGLVKDQNQEIIKIAENLNPAELEEQGKQLAEKLKNKIPLIYSSYKLKSLSYIWKIKFNENSKIPAFAHCIPEMNHNEMEGFSIEDLNKNFYIILLDDDSDTRISKRMNLTAQILKERNISVEIIKLKKENIPSTTRVQGSLETIFSYALLADWISYYLALNYGVNPFNIDIIEDFKERMRK